jgi:hypothetical protein
MHQSHCDYLLSSFRGGIKRFLFLKKEEKRLQTFYSEYLLQHFPQETKNAVVS